jgi:hypothetical protein
VGTSPVKKYEPKHKPVDPGFYWVSQAGEMPYLVEVFVESDSHGMFYVLLSDHNHKYSTECWSGALWFGPLEMSDIDTSPCSCI